MIGFASSLWHIPWATSVAFWRESNHTRLQRSARIGATTVLMKIAILRFGGSNCELDVQKALNNLGVHAELVWYKEVLEGFDGAIIPGGFSYGDYLRAGAIAARTKIMQSVREMAADGKPILGICNGAQILSE